MPVRTRFAPSPTGFMHVGGVRTALFAWLVAKQSSGQFVLRIEDTDKAREVEGSEAHIMECLKWLGLEWDEGPDKDGPSGPYRQSERLDIYKQEAQKLLEAGRAYADPYSQEELEQLRNKSKEAKKPFLFRDYRPENPPAWDGSQPLRFKSDPKDYAWHDEVMGDLSSGEEAIDDFILIKSDGYPTYNFAHIIDDNLMKITHVIRSQEFLPSVPKFLNLYDALHIDWPKFATLPYVLGPDGKKKLSKRDGAKDILDYKKQGYLAEALVSFLATLGWNDGTTQEVFTVDELISKFSLERVQRSGAKFDEQRLDWTNGHLIRQMGLDELYELVQNSEQNYWGVGQQAEESYKKEVLGLVQERLKHFDELASLTGFFFKEPEEHELENLYKNPSDKLLKGREIPELKEILQKTIEKLAQTDFTSEALQTSLNGLLEALNTKPGVLFPLIRIALSGQTSSPEIIGTLNVLGKDKSLTRLKRAVAILDS
ncbi:glutamate--tRNA ligase [Candidatus Saccharibacteria bacterium]|nr:glutamate--tRNA ligase [Candidatus Saccharibacteria bacterium]